MSSCSIPNMPHAYSSDMNDLNEAAIMLDETINQALRKTPLRKALIKCSQEALDSLSEQLRSTIDPNMDPGKIEQIEKESSVIKLLLKRPLSREEDALKRCLEYNAQKKDGGPKTQEEYIELKKACNRRKYGYNSKAALNFPSTEVRAALKNIGLVMTVLASCAAVGYVLKNTILKIST